MKLIHKLLLFSGGGAPAVSVTPSSWDFGSTPVGTPKTKIFTISNSGDGALEITLPITIVGAEASAFTVTVQPAETSPGIVTLAPNASTTFIVQADADVVDSFAANISISSNVVGSPTLIAIEVVVNINFLLRDDFTTDDAAPLVAPRTAEPGPGTWAVTDSANKLSISSGALQVASGTGTADPALHGDSLTRAAGLTVAATLTPATTSPVVKIGFDLNNSGDNPYSILFNAGGEIRVQDNTIYVTVGTFTATVYSVAVVNRPTGLMVFIKGGTFTNWTLLLVTKTLNSTPVYPSLTFATTSGASSIALARAAQLDATLFNPLIDIAAPAVNTGSIAPGVEVALTADFVLEVVITSEPSSDNNDFHFRVQDASNYWLRRITTTGAVELYEVIAGVATLRASSAAAFAAGQTSELSVRNETIRIYADNASKINYSSAVNFKTATAWTYAAIGTGGDEDNLKIWQGNYPSGSLAARLDEMVAP